MKRRVNKLKGFVALLVMLLMLTSALPAFAVIVDVQDSIIPILSVEVQRQDQAVVGQEFEVVYNIKNISNKPAFNLLLGFTDEGCTMAAALAEIQHRSIEPLFAGFTLEEQQALQDYLRRMDANILRCLQKE